MSSILYYSNYCNNCKPLLQKLSHTSIKDDIHFICIDKRVKKPNGITNIVLENGQELLLPHTITKVPALMLLNRGNKVLFGEEISNHIERSGRGITGLILAAIAELRGGTRAVR